MSAHFSKFYLDTYRDTPYFEACLPADYPFSQVLMKCRSFRRLPPNLRELAGLAKRWAERVWGWPPDVFLPWYDEEGYELDPGSGERLTDEQIDESWRGQPEPDVEVEDIPVPDGGFPDPDTWEEPLPPVDEPDEEDVPSEGDLLRWMRSHGRQRVASDYGLSPEEVAAASSNVELARAIIDRRQGLR